MAYYVVYLNVKQKYVIVPAIWIKDIEHHYEKFVNNSLNRSQLFLCFYPDESSQSFIDGQPDENFAPDFQSENCFTGKLKRYFARYDDAQKYMQNLRNVEPSIYNPRRLMEQPIPDIGNQTSVTVSISPKSSSTDDSFENDDTGDHNEYRALSKSGANEGTLNESDNVEHMVDTGPFGDHQSSTENDEDLINETTNSQNMNDIDPLGDSLLLVESVAIDNVPMNSTNDDQSKNDTHCSQSNPKPNEIATDSTENIAETADNENAANSLPENDQSIVQLQIVAVESLANAHDSESAVDSTNDEATANEATESHQNSHAAARESPNNIQSNSSECLVEPENNGSDAQNLESNSLDATGIVKHEYVPLFNIHSANNEAIDEVLDDELEPEEVNYGDDVVMIIGQTGVPLPLETTKDDLIKREMDPISGKIPFDNRRDGRVYKIGNKHILVPKKAVDKMIEWNTGHKRDEIRYDRKFCQALLLSLVDKQQLKQSNIDAEVMEFIKDCLAIRCGANEEERVASIEKVIEDICCEHASNSK